MYEGGHQNEKRVERKERRRARTCTKERRRKTKPWNGTVRRGGELEKRTNDEKKREKMRSLAVARRGEGDEETAWLASQGQILYVPGLVLTNRSGLIFFDEDGGADNGERESGGKLATRKYERGPARGKGGGALGAKRFSAVAGWPASI